MPPATLDKGWLIAEDEALKTYLSDMKVADSSAPVGGRSVPVWFRLPEPEQRQRTYPYVTIELIDMVEAHDRVQVNSLKVSSMVYSPPDPIPAEVVGKTIVADRPIPIDLVYQITVVARNARHDTQLRAALWRKFPGKWGALYVPNDETARTMQRLDTVGATDMDDHGKRTFRRMYTVSVASELWPTVIKQIQNLTEINIGITLTGDASLVIAALDCYSDS